MIKGMLLTKFKINFISVCMFCTFTVKNCGYSRLRNKIEDNPEQPEYLVTYKGIGYRLTV